jgi:hypothetical protein
MTAECTGDETLENVWGEPEYRGYRMTEGILHATKASVGSKRF